MKHKRGAGAAARRPPSLFSSWVFAAVVLLLLAFFISDTLWRRAALTAVSSVRTAEDIMGVAAVSSDAKIRYAIPPIGSMDARWWIIYAERQLDEGILRIRRNLHDNFPLGREVHWSSLPLWALSALSVVLSLMTGPPASQCVQDASLIFGPVTLAASLLLLGWMAWRVFTPALTGFFLLAFAVSPSVYQAFRPGEVDHHGIVLAFLTAGLLALLVAGKTQQLDAQRRSAKSSRVDAARWAWAAGAFHGAALWISASSTIPLLFGCALGAVAAAFAVRPGLIAPPLLQTWGWAGCLASIFFYLIEYFPQHMGWRLEVNHPLWSLAWLGGAFLLSQVLTMVGGQKIAWSRLLASKTLVAVALLLLPAVLLARFPAQTFVVSDPFLLDLHRRFISEFQSLRAFFAENNLFPGCFEVGLLPVLSLGLVAIMLRYRALLAEYSAASAVFLAGPVIVMQLLAFWQIRWGITAVGLWSLFATVCLSSIFALRGAPRILAVVMTSVAVLILLALPVLVWAGLANRSLTAEQVPESATPSILARDLAHRLVQAAGGKVPVVLSGPTTSTDLAYFAGIKVFGTLYWENRDGLAHAARLFAESSPEELKRLLGEAGADFILVPSWEDFAVPYSELSGLEDENSPSFIGRLTAGEDPPRWLRPLHYPDAYGFGVRLFRFMPSQSLTQASLHLGVFHFERQDWNRARSAFVKAAALDPSDPAATAWLQRADQALKQHQK